MYRLGEGVEKDSIQAFLWYQKAAEQGDAFGQYNLGWSINYLVVLIPNTRSL